MNVIIPMAGMGKRMRPHTLTIPKPLIQIAGKPIVQRLVEEIIETCNQKAENICFVIGDFGKEVESMLIQIAEDLGAKGHIRYQDEPLGTGHAILCGKDFMEGDVFVAFADTLFKADKMEIDESKGGIIYVKTVEDPRPFGVVKLDSDNIITEFVEKPEEFVSDLAIIGIYYFRDGEMLKNEIQYLIDNNIKDKGEFQLTSAMDNMRKKGIKFAPGKVDEWLDCGNKDNTLNTHSRVLHHMNGSIKNEATLDNATIIQPTFLGKNVKITNSVVGPHVSIGDNSIVEDSIIKASIVQNDSIVKQKILNNSMIGNSVNLTGKSDELNIGDYSLQNETTA